MEMKKPSESPIVRDGPSFNCHLFLSLDKDMLTRYPIESEDESKRSNGYHEQNLSSMVYTTPDIKYTSF